MSDEEPFEYWSESYKASSGYSESFDSSGSPVQKKTKKKKDSAPSLSEPCTSASLQTPAEYIQHKKIVNNQIASGADASTSAYHVEETIENVVRNLQWDSDSSSDEVLESTADLQRNEVKRDFLKKFTLFAQDWTINDGIQVMHDKQPVDFFLLFVDEDLLNLMVQETNKYASQKAGKTNLPHARILNWKYTNIQEMKVFLGMQIWIRLVQMPKLICYWSNNALYSNEIKSVMSRNRLELLLSNWHFSDNESANILNKLCKIKPLVNHISEKFQNDVTPSCNVCVDETLVPLRGRLAFLQYIKNKKHKFGVKLFKLCIEEGYTTILKFTAAQKKRIPPIACQHL